MKSVVIASGKGGTGKTTLTALLAHKAATDLRVALADADVEASNLPIALRVDDVTCEVFEGGSVARVTDPGRCEACGRCAEVCRFDALFLDTSLDSYVVDPLACEGCGYCARVCPVSVIEMRTSNSGRICVGASTLGPIAFGQLGPGEDLSGKLVTQVRQRALDVAARHGADLLLIDGPPGIGCPVIAAITNTDLLLAVTEPTVSGEHDLSRLIDLAGRFSLPVGVVLNKSDLSAPGAQSIRALCEARNVPLVAEIGFDPRIAGALAALAENPKGSESGLEMPALDTIWAWTRSILGHTLQASASGRDS